ncbi:hypothetical protein BMG05_10960 [Mycobacterium malmoense]|nr:hypothetical protein BMG05_10960 [Mycobacterium malmoense]
MVRRSPWLDERTSLLVRILAEKHGMQLVDGGFAAMREEVSEHLDFVAERMRIGRQAAKMYVTNDVIDQMAYRLATEVRQRQVKGRDHLWVVE